jgi:type VI secretion system secreted protein VgrG
MGGGKGRGVGVLPSVGDEVVVAAVDGDPEHLVVLGGLWNGVDGAGHAPGRQHWVTPAGNTLCFVEGKAGEDLERVELHTKEGKAWVQLAQKGPTGVPTVSIHAEGDVAIEAPNGELRLVAKRMTTHVETDALREVKGRVVDKVTGPVTLASEARLALKGGEVAVVAGGGLHAHAGGTHTLTGGLVTLNPSGAQAPGVDAQVPPKAASAWGPRPVPGPGPGRSTEDPKTPTRRELAQRAQPAAVTAEPAAPSEAPEEAPEEAPAADGPLAAATGPEPTSLAAKQQRLAARRALIQDARARASQMPPGEERSELLATAARFEDDTRAVDRARLAQHVYQYYADNSVPSPVGFSQITGDEPLAAYGLTPEDLAPPRSNFRAALYRSELDPSAGPILAYRGTIFNSAEDWKNNLQQGLGIPSAHYQQAVDVAERLSEATEGRFETVGHSLGGGMAGLVSTVHGVPGDTFNPAGVNETTLQRYGSTRSAGADLVRTYQVRGEILTAVQSRNGQRAVLAGATVAGGPVGSLVAGGLFVARELAGNRVLPSAVGRARTLPAVDPPEYQGFWNNFNPMRSVNRHSIETVIDGFEQEKSADAGALGGVDPRR